MVARSSLSRGVFLSCTLLLLAWGAFIAQFFKGQDSSTTLGSHVTSQSKISGINGADTPLRNINNSLQRPLWHSSLLAMYYGTAFGEKISCATKKVVAEWNICWTSIERHIASRNCTVYSFGIAQDDPFTNYMAEAGCQVFAFDPAQNHPRDYKPNVTFYQYGLVSGIRDENSYEHIGWGKTDSAQYKTLLEIQEELGHTDTTISALKIDCEGETTLFICKTDTNCMPSRSSFHIIFDLILLSDMVGCEWKLFADIDDKALSRIDQILTEFHFTTSLRFNGDIAEKYVQKCVDNLKKYYGISHYQENAGAWYDRHIDDGVAAAGIPTTAQSVRMANGKEIVSNTGRCCNEMTFIKS